MVRGDEVGLATALGAPAVQVAGLHRRGFGHMAGQRTLGVDLVQARLLGALPAHLLPPGGGVIVAVVQLQRAGAGPAFLAQVEVAGPYPVSGAGGGAYAGEACRPLQARRAGVDLSPPEGGAAGVEIAVDVARAHVNLKRPFDPFRQRQLPGGVVHPGAGGRQGRLRPVSFFKRHAEAQPPALALRERPLPAVLIPHHQVVQARAGLYGGSQGRLAAGRGRDRLFIQVDLDAGPRVFLQAESISPAAAEGGQPLPGSAETCGDPFAGITRPPIQFQPAPFRARFHPRQSRRRLSRIPVGRAPHAGEDCAVQRAQAHFLPCHPALHGAALVHRAAQGDGLGDQLPARGHVDHPRFAGCTDRVGGFQGGGRRAVIHLHLEG